MAVDVATFATGGLGTSANPWTGWGTAFAAGSYNAYYFRSGYFSTALLDLSGLKQIRLYGAGTGASVILGTGSGNVIAFGATLPTTFGIKIDDLWIKSTGSATNGIYWKSVHYSTIRNVKVTDVTNACVYQEFGVSNTFQDIRCTGNEEDQRVRPAYGLYFTRLSTPETSTLATIIGGHYDQLTTAGIWFESMGGAALYNVTSEGNAGKGVYISANCAKMTIDGLHLEANRGTGLEVAGGYSHSFRGVFCDGTVTSAAHRSLWQACVIQHLSLTGNYNDVDNLLHSLNGGGGLIDSGVGNRKSNIASAATIGKGGVPEPDRVNRGQITRTPNGKEGTGFDPGYNEFTHQRIDLIDPKPVSLSSTAFPTGKPWRVLFIGYWSDIRTGPGLEMQPLMREVTSESPSFTVGTRTVTVSQSSDGLMQVAGTDSGFVGTVHIVVGNYATGLSTTSMVLQGDLSAGGIGRHMTGSWYQTPTVAASQRNVALTSGAYPRGWIAPRAGSITAVVVNLATSRSVGELEVVVQKSTDSGATWADVAGASSSIATNVSKGVTLIARGTATFAANDMLRAVVSTDDSWAPTSNTLDASFEVEIV